MGVAALPTSHSLPLAWPPTELRLLQNASAWIVLTAQRRDIDKAYEDLVQVVMAPIVVAYIGMAYIVMAYIVMALWQRHR